MKMLPMKLRRSTPKKLLSFWRFNLAILILLLSFFSVVVTAVNWYMAIYTVQKNTLETSTLSSNLAYSEKLSATISDFFDFSILKFVLKRFIFIQQKILEARFSPPNSTFSPPFPPSIFSNFVVFRTYVTLVGE